jgi:tetratricopeptide (TPR) repeat protein
VSANGATAKLTGYARDRPPIDERIGMGLHHRYDCSVSTFAALILSMTFFVASASAQSIQQECANQSGDRAIAACSQALRLDPNDTTSYFNRGNQWRNKGENDKAIADFTAAIGQNPQDAEFYNNRGVVWRKKGELDIAIAAYDEAIKLNPQYWEARNNRGSARYSKREHSKGIADYNLHGAISALISLGRTRQFALLLDATSA